MLDLSPGDGARVIRPRLGGASFQTPFCRMLGLMAPIVQAPVGSAATPELAAAVSNAGGLGMLALTWTSPDAVGARP